MIHSEGEAPRQRQRKGHHVKPLFGMFAQSATRHLSEALPPLCERHRLGEFLRAQRELQKGVAAMIFDWLRENPAHRDVITADAKALIDEHGADALSEARYLALREYEGGPLGDRPRGHWGEVRDELRRLWREDAKSNAA